MPSATGAQARYLAGIGAGDGSQIGEPQPDQENPTGHKGEGNETEALGCQKSENQGDARKWKDDWPDCHSPRIPATAMTPNNIQKKAAIGASRLIRDRTHEASRARSRLPIRLTAVRNELMANDYYASIYLSTVTEPKDSISVW